MSTHKWKRVRFTVTEGHVKLTKRMVVRSAYGTPYIDQKRPYGNSDILRDIHAIAGTVPILTNSDGEHFSDDQDKAAWKLHKDMDDVLQIGLVVGRFEPGEYWKDEYDYDGWELVPEDQRTKAPGSMP